MKKSDRVITDSGNRLSLECFLVLIKGVLILGAVGMLLDFMASIHRYGIESRLTWMKVGAYVGSIVVFWFLHEVVCLLAEIADRHQVIKINQRRSYTDELR
jgi:hypothetical protein